MALCCVPLDARVCNAIRLSTLMSLIGSFNFSHISFSFRLFVDGKYFFILLCLAFTSIPFCASCLCSSRERRVRGKKMHKTNNHLNYISCIVVCLRLKRQVSPFTSLSLYTSPFFTRHIIAVHVYAQLSLTSIMQINC